MWISAVVLVVPGSVWAWCQMQGPYDSVHVGEVRYQVEGGTDTYYANAYHDGGQELAIPEDSLIGYLPSGNTFAGVVGAVSILDTTTTDCKDVLLWMDFARDTSAQACGTWGTDYTASTVNINTCTYWNGANETSKLFYGNYETFIGPISKHYRYETDMAVKVVGGSPLSEDFGCFRLGDINNVSCY